MDGDGVGRVEDDAAGWEGCWVCDVGTQACPAGKGVGVAAAGCFGFGIEWDFGFGSHEFGDCRGKT